MTSSCAGHLDAPASHVIAAVNVIGNGQLRSLCGSFDGGSPLPFVLRVDDLLLSEKVVKEVHLPYLRRLYVRFGDGNRSLDPCCRCRMTEAAP